MKRSGTKTATRLCSDDGNATVSMLILLPLILCIFITILDTGLWLSSSSQLKNISRDGARTVSIMGGAGDAMYATPLENKYGLTREQACSGVAGKWIVKDAFSPRSTPIECSMMKAIASTPGLVNVHVEKVSCTPKEAGRIGEDVSCTIAWRYGGIPGSAFSFMTKASGGAPFVHNTTTGTATSEVGLNGVPMQKRV